MRKVYLQWTDFKTLITSKQLKMQYEITETGYYYIWASELNTEYSCRIKIETPKSADQVEFEDNFMADSNQTACILAKIIGNLTATLVRYRPRFYTSRNNIALSDSVDTELISIDVDGQLDAISANFDRDDVEFVLSIDGTEVLRIELDDLENTSRYALDSADGDVA